MATNLSMRDDAPTHIYTAEDIERAVQSERERCAAACRTVLDMKEEARAEQQTRTAKGLDDELRALRHYSTVSTFNAGVRRCIAAILG